MALLFKLFRQRLFLTLATVCVSGLTAAVSLWWNAQLSSIIDTAGTGNALSQTVLVRALFTILAMAISAYVKTYTAGYTCESLTHDLRMGYAQYFTSLSIAEVESLSTGEQISKLQNEIADVSVYMNANLFQLLDDSIKFVLTFAWLLSLSPVLTLASNLPLVIIIAYVFHASKVISSAATRSQQAKSSMNSYAETLLALFPVIRLYRAAQMVLKGYDHALKTWEHQTMRAERIKARLMSLSGLLSSIPLILLFRAGGTMTINGILSIGTLYVFLNLSGNIWGVMMNMPGYIASFRQFSANMERLLQYVFPGEGGQ